MSPVSAQHRSLMTAIQQYPSAASSWRNDENDIQQLIARGFVVRSGSQLRLTRAGEMELDAASPSKMSAQDVLAGMARQALAAAGRS